MTIGAFANGDSGSSIRTKLNSAIGILDGTSAQTWAAPQSFSTITGSAVTVSSPGTAQSVSLDGRIHVIQLADATETTITGTPTGSGYSSAIVRVKGSPAGTGTIAWPAGHIAMNSQSLNATAGAYTDFMLDSHDGSTVLYRGVGVQT